MKRTGSVDRPRAVRQCRCHTISSEIPKRRQTTRPDIQARAEQITNRDSQVGQLLDPNTDLSAGEGKNDADNDSVLKRIQFADFYEPVPVRLRPMKNSVG